MKFFRDLFKELSGYRSVREVIEKKITPVSVTGLSHIHRANLIYSLAEDKVNILITGSEAEERRFCDDINMMSGTETAVLFPSKELVFTPVDTSNHEYEHMRISALSKVLKRNSGVICASIEAVMQPTIPAERLISAGIEITTGQETDIQELTRKLVINGYQRCEKVEGASQFSVRGSIIDIFPVQTEKPVRIELWGDETDTISYFETDTQRRTESLDSIEIPPASEILYDNNKLADNIEKLIKKLRGKRA